MILALGCVLSAALAADPAPRGFDRPGFGVELNGSVAAHRSSGTNESLHVLGPQWELGLRFRFGQFLSVGVSGETVSGIIGGAGEDANYNRKQIALDVQWRFWGYQGIVRPWAGAGMAWGTIHESTRDEYFPDSNPHVWEFLRLAVGLDVVIAHHLAIGPWARVGFAHSEPGTFGNTYPPGSASLLTWAIGLRTSVAVP